MQWLGELNIYGRFNNAVGDGVIANDSKGIIFTLNGMAKGNYQIKTYHYASRANSNDHDPMFEYYTG